MKIYRVRGDVGGDLDIKAETFGEAERKFRQYASDARIKSMTILSIEIVSCYFIE